jgi:hypothetical protein
MKLPNHTISILFLALSDVGCLVGYSRVKHMQFVHVTGRLELMTSATEGLCGGK